MTLIIYYLSVTFVTFNPKSNLIMKQKLYILVAALLLIGCNSKIKQAENLNKTADNSQRIEKEIKIIPISHATAVIEYDDLVIYLDPVGGQEAFKAQKKPQLVLITDIHGDHLSFETLKELDLYGSVLVAPKAVIDEFPDDFKPMHKVLNNGESTIINNINIEAVPMYNLREEALKFHQKGRGNGYVINLGGERTYISGDTEDIPEMRTLKNIDKALVCMNLPYTMTVESAASAVLDFKPKQVYPYHYRGTDGFSDVEEFKNLVNKTNPEIEVVQLNWYPN